MTPLKCNYSSNTTSDNKNYPNKWQTNFENNLQCTLWQEGTPTTQGEIEYQNKQAMSWEWKRIQDSPRRWSKGSCRREKGARFVNHLLGVSQALWDKTRLEKHWDKGQTDRWNTWKRKEGQTDVRGRRRKEGQTTKRKEILGTEAQTKKKELE